METIVFVQASFAHLPIETVHACIPFIFHHILLYLSFSHINPTINITLFPHPSGTLLDNQFSYYIASQFPSSTLIFTNGSKSDQEFVWHSTFRPIPTSTHISSLTYLTPNSAAIQIFLYIEHNFNEGPSLIISDSLSALQAITSAPIHTNHSLAIHITLFF